MDDSDSDAADQNYADTYFKVNLSPLIWTDYVCYVFCRTIIFFIKNRS